MSAELFFIYDSHCPWSYATTTLVNEIATAFPEIELHLWHSARYEGDDHVKFDTINAVKAESNLHFSDRYIKQLTQAKDSTVAANLMAWANNKIPQLSLSLLNAIQEQHFEQGLELTNADDFDSIVADFKLSPPQKVFNKDKLAKESEINLHDIFELQEVIGTNAIPALLLAIDENLILLNHHLYLSDPKSIVDAVKLELKD